MDNEEPKPNINMKKDTDMGGGMRASSSSRKKNANLDPMLAEVLAKVNDAESVLVALSSDPSVDEMAAAMGLSMALDNAGKRATAIYSGKTPNVLEFLKPEERFETGTESLQDFVIALNKDKADHLRYKVDGDFVKVYVTPYKTTISDDDLEFSRGDYNIDLVISLNVPAATELDAALKEHGRIMHDATSINITNGAAGKFGEIEWVDASASSITEMVAKLVFELNPEIDAATATALLTGLVAATNRFSSPATTPDAMMLAAKLMNAGADQQLVAQNMEGEVVFSDVMNGEAPEAAGNDASKLEIDHEEEDAGMAPVNQPAVEETPAEMTPPAMESMNDEQAVAPEPAPIAPNPIQAPEGNGTESVQDAMADVLAPPAPEIKPLNSGMGATQDANAVPGDANGFVGETVTNDIVGQIQKENTNVGTVDYGKLIDEALNEPLPGEGGIQVGAQTMNGPQVDTQDVDAVQVTQGAPIMAMANAAENAAMASNEQNQTMNDNGGFPPIVPRGDSGYDNPGATDNGMNGSMMGMEGNPATMSAPNMNGMTDAAGVPDMNFGNGTDMGQVQAPVSTDTTNPMTTESMPMPGQDMTPPPVLPQPNFGEMPPAMPDMGAMQPENVVAPASEPAPAASEVTVQPDLAVGPTMDASGLPQMPAVQGATMSPMSPAGNTGESQSSSLIASSAPDPSAFKIPGIHT